MPTDRFYRLPEEKKQTIREAAIKEFARVPFEKASINQIIRNADISRGSFYTYFADKQDVVMFIFEDSHEQMKQQCREALKSNGGDYFGMLKMLFEMLVEKLQETKNMLDMVRNVFSYQENASALGFTSMADSMFQSGLEQPMSWITDNVDTRGWRLNLPNDMGPLMTMGMAALMIALTQYYKCPDDLETVRRLYEKKLEILRWGVYSRES